MTGYDQVDAASVAAMAEFLREYESIDNYPADRLFEAELPMTTFSNSSPTTSNDGNSTDDNVSGISVNASKDAAPDAVKRRRELANAKAAKRRLRYLNKLKDERTTLERQERELRAQLKMLQRQKLAQDEANSFELGVWRSTAVRQRDWRELAEQQQQQLKAAVLSRANLIHRMTELLQHCLFNCETIDSYPPTSDTKQTSLFRTFISELKSLYTQTDDVINTMDFELSPPLTYRLTRDWNKDMTFLESTNATVIPFDFDQACRAVSLLLLAPGYTGEIDDDENTVTRAYRLDYTSELGEGATLMVYIVVRRYVEAGRVVFVWRGLAEGQGEFEGLYTDESAWFVLRLLKTDTDEGPAMVLQSYTRLVPIGFDLKSDTDERVNRFVDILAKTDETDVNDMKQMMAKLLQHE